ncbi:serine/threonine-protein kinase [Rhodococcus sp. 24CO]|uniref:serine/threonine-protein kinase n=1 Tax=Rhodococcus sp. 24CO TaxID=3117460 RepID=UPI003D33C1C2
MTKRDAQSNDATVASGPLTRRGPETEVRRGTERFSPTSSPAQLGGDGREQLVDDWEAGRAPTDLLGYLPDPAAIRRASLIDLVRADMECRWLRENRPKRLSEYCVEYPELLDEPLPAELLYEEFRFRRQRGEKVAVPEYLTEFPAQAEALENLIERDAAAGPPAIVTLESSGFDRFEVGQRFDDFELMMEIGQGAFARVFLARQLSMQRWVALKISQNVGVEPQTLARLDHPHIVRVFDQRVLEDQALRVLIMEYVPGGTLLEVVRLVRRTPPELRCGRLLLDSIDQNLARKGEMQPSETSLRREVAGLSWPETVAWIGMRLADALEYAREHGVLHRDIKPANVLLTVEGIPKLADFNVSSSDVESEDAACLVGGSVAYMSPEQLEACSLGVPGNLDTRSDIYSLGVMLWELLTGSRPFADDGTRESAPSPAAALAIRRRGVDPAAQEHLPEDCPAALRRVLVKSLALERDARWSGGRKLARQFALCLDRHARDLVDPAPSSPRSVLWRWAPLILLAAIWIPNPLAAGYNYYYNKMLILSTLSPQVQQHLEQVHLAIGAVTLAMGTTLILFWCRRALTVPRGLHLGQTYSADVLSTARSATLYMGHRAVVICFGLWVLAGIAYPIALQVLAGGIPPRAYVHLMSSLAVCGAVAVAYPFFLLTFYSVRCLYPILLSHGELRSGDGRDLRKLGRISTRYLAVAASVPLVGIAGLSLVGGGAGEDINATVRLLCLFGIFGFVGIYQLFRWIESDLRALSRVVTLEASASP